MKAAIISDCGRYRYLLTRKWDDACASLPFVMLNPSTADHEIDDPTIRRCIGFSKREGYGGISVLNLYAFRSTKPEGMMDAEDAQGPGNFMHLQILASTSANLGVPIVCAWGAHWMADALARPVLALFKQAGAHAVCLGLTKLGAPKHPLYVRADAPLIPFGRVQ